MRSLRIASAVVLLLVGAGCSSKSGSSGMDGGFNGDRGKPDAKSGSSHKAAGKGNDGNTGHDGSADADGSTDGSTKPPGDGGVDTGVDAGCNFNAYVYGLIAHDTTPYAQPSPLPGCIGYTAFDAGLFQ